MSRLANQGNFSPIEVYTTNSNPGGTYNYADGQFDTQTGSRFRSSDGRQWVIVANGSSALAAGKTVAAVANTANHLGNNVVTFTAYSANGNIPAQLTVTVGATQVLQNEYQGGLASIKSGTGLGQTLRIASNTACASSGTTTITFENPDGQNMTALDTTSVLDLFRNPYGSGIQTYNNSGVAQSLATNGVVVGAHASPTLNVIGVSTYSVPASTTTFASYGLIQTNGRVAILNDATTATVGLDIMPSTATDGAISLYAVASGARIGTALEAGVSAQYTLCELQL